MTTATSSRASGYRPAGPRTGATLVRSTGDVARPPRRTVELSRRPVGVPAGVAAVDLGGRRLGAKRRRRRLHGRLARPTEATGPRLAPPSEPRQRPGPSRVVRAAATAPSQGSMANRPPRSRGVCSPAPPAARRPHLATQVCITPPGAHLFPREDPDPPSNTTQSSVAGLARGEAARSPRPLQRRVVSCTGKQADETECDAVRRTGVPAASPMTTATSNRASGYRPAGPRTGATMGRSAGEVARPPRRIVERIA